MQAYSDPKRESEPHVLPDIEVWHVDERTPADECPHCLAEADEGGPSDDQDAHETDHCGWYWWSCFPGCLPDGEPNGPFETEAEALADAREGVEVDGDDFPENTATVWDARGFPHEGHLGDQRDAQNGTALYYFPGDFVAGEGFELWLDPATAADAEMLADCLTCDDEQWSTVAPAEEK